MSGVILPMGELVERVREHPIRRAWMPWEYRTSWWVPIQGPMDGKLYLAGFFYPVTERPGEPAQVGRPQFHGAVDPTTGQFVQVTACSFHDFAAHLPPDPALGVLSPEQAPARTAAEWGRLREELHAAYDLLLPVAFRDAGQLTGAQREGVGRFRRAFDTLVEPFLRPYYQALNPAFFVWLNEAS